MNFAGLTRARMETSVHTSTTRLGTKLKAPIIRCFTLDSSGIMVDNWSVRGPWERYPVAAGSHGMLEAHPTPHPAADTREEKFLDPEPLSKPGAQKKLTSSQATPGSSSAGGNSNTQDMPATPDYSEDSEDDDEFMDHQYAPAEGEGAQERGLAPTLLSHRFKGIPPSPIKSKPVRVGNGWATALEEQNGCFTYLHSRGSFTCSHELSETYDKHGD
ncbi:hypothetical protein GGU11DRAFT_761606, partial [Lentinula aff. detonsa]